MTDFRILPAITCISKKHIQKIRECHSLGVKEAALFLTTLEKTERQACYRELEQSGLITLPIVHLRSDMEAEELAYFCQRWQVQAFNVHSAISHPFSHDQSRFRQMIYLENSEGFEIAELKKWG